MTQPPESWEQAYHRLAAAYAAALEARLGEMETQWRTLLEESHGALAGPALAGLERRAHRMRGSAGTFGLPAVSYAAARLECALGVLMEQSVAPLPQQLAAVTHAMATLRRAAARPARAASEGS